MSKEHWTIRALEFVPWKPSEVVFLPDEGVVYHFSDVWRAVDTVNKELSWIMAQNKDEN